MANLHPHRDRDPEDGGIFRVFYQRQCLQRCCLIPSQWTRKEQQPLSILFLKTYELFDEVYVISRVKAIKPVILYRRISLS